MQTLQNLAQLDELKHSEDALLVLFGGRDCNVCHAIKPKLLELMGEHYPKMTLVYVDCHETTELCAQNGVFTLPTLQVFFGGQRFVEEVRSFSLQKVVQDLARPYSMMFSR